MNLIIATGNIGKDAEQKFTQGGDSIVSFSLPVKSGFGDKAKTSWVRCTMFGKSGESVLPYLVKGVQVGVSGEFSMNEWIDKEGQKRATAECRVNVLTLLGGKPNNQAPAEGRTQPADRGRKPAGSTPSGSFDDMDNDIPFLFNMNTLCDTMGQPLSLWRAKYGKGLSVVRANKTDF